jgi:pimeloyl-ACP methyl ester carboxylesterase
VNKLDPNGNANFFIGGNSDPADGTRSSWISNFWRSFSSSSVSASFDSPNNISDALYTYDQADQKQDWSPSGPSTAAEDIIALKQAHPDEPINIFGHSWGARSAMNLTQELSAAGIKVDNVITLDPVSEDENWTS